VCYSGDTPQEACYQGSSIVVAALKTLPEASFPKHFTIPLSQASRYHDQYIYVIVVSLQKFQQRGYSWLPVPWSLYHSANFSLFIMRIGNSEQNRRLSNRTS
jgi:hypothetical protein